MCVSRVGRARLEAPGLHSWLPTQRRLGWAEPSGHETGWRRCRCGLPPSASSRPAPPARANHPEPRELNPAVDQGLSKFVHRNHFRRGPPARALDGAINRAKRGMAPADVGARSAGAISNTGGGMPPAEPFRRAAGGCRRRWLFRRTARGVPPTGLRPSQPGGGWPWGCSATGWRTSSAGSFMPPRLRAGPAISSRCILTYQ